MSESREHKRRYNLRLEFIALNVSHPCCFSGSGENGSKGDRIGRNFPRNSSTSMTHMIVEQAVLIF